MAFLHHHASLLLRNMYGLVVNLESISCSLTFGGGNPWTQASKQTLATGIPATRISCLKIHYMQHLQCWLECGSWFLCLVSRHLSFPVLPPRRGLPGTIIGEHFEDAQGD